MCGIACLHTIKLPNKAYLLSFGRVVRVNELFTWHLLRGSYIGALASHSQRTVPRGTIAFVETSGFDSSAAHKRQFFTTCGGVKVMGMSTMKRTGYTTGTHFPCLHHAIPSSPSLAPRHCGSRAWAFVYKFLPQTLPPALCQLLLSLLHSLATRSFQLSAALDYRSSFLDILHLLSRINSVITPNT